jgi:hypothetical protein
MAQQLGQMQTPVLTFCQLVVIASDNQATTIVAKPKDICSVMEPNGATSRYCFIQI